MPANSKKTEKKTKDDAPTINKSRHLTMQVKSGVTADRAIAELALNPSTANASTALDYTKGLYAELNLQDFLDVMKADVKQVNEGKLENLEGMLTSQATVLNAIFNNFAKRAINADYLPQVDTYLRLALKAQSQCRTTVEAIAEIKFPKAATFIRQANMGQNVQVNNGESSATLGGQNCRPAEEVNKHINELIGATPAQERNIKLSNELLTEAANATLDKGRTGEASKAYSKLEAVGKINGS